MRVLVSFLTCLLILQSSGNPVKDYQYDETYDDSYNYDEDANGYDEEIPKPAKEEKAPTDNISAAKRPTIETKAKEIAVDQGTTIRLPCMVDNLPVDVMILWHKVDHDNTMIAMGSSIPLESYRARASVEVTPKGSVLIIGAARQEDAGQYKCSIAIPEQRLPEVKHTVVIRAPPSIHSSSEAKLEAEKGQNVKMYCKGNGSPRPTLKWTRVGKGLLPDGKAELEAEELLLTSVTRHHAGVYRCTASNGFGKADTKDIELRVLFKPEIEAEEVFIHTKAGNEVELVCTVHAVPHATVTWTKNGQPLSTATDRMRVDSHHSRHSLTIQSVAREDYGKYACSANSIKGSAEKTIEISGKARPADFKSRPEGEAETSFLMEWTSLSYTPLTEFRLEVRREGGQWQEISLPAHQEGAYHYVGKRFLNDLEVATRYEARVSALNAEGWSTPSPIFYFATKGAEPRQAEVTGGAAGGQSICLPLVILALALFSIN